MSGFYAGGFLHSCQIISAFRFRILTLTPWRRNLLILSRRCASARIIRQSHDHVDCGFIAAPTLHHQQSTSICHERLLSELCEKDKHSSGAHRLSRDVLKCLVAVCPPERHSSLAALSLKDFLSIVSDCLCDALEKEEQHSCRGSVFSKSDNFSSALLARCARQLASVGASALTCGSRLFSTLLSAVMRRGRDPTRVESDVRAAIEVGDVCSLEGVRLSTSVLQDFPIFLLQGLKLEAERGWDDVGSSAGAGWWSSNAVRIDRMYQSKILPSDAAESMQMIIWEQIVRRLSKSSLEEAVQSWKRLHRFPNLSDDLALEVGKVLQQSVLTGRPCASARHPVGENPRGGLPRSLVAILCDLADLGWRCPKSARLTPGQEKQLLEMAIRHEHLGSLDPGRLGSLAEACVAVGFPTSSAFLLLQVVSSVIVQRQDILTLRHVVDMGIRMALAGASDIAVFSIMKHVAEKAVETERRMKPQWIVCVAARLALCGIDCPKLFRSLAALRSKSFVADIDALWPEERRAMLAMEEGTFDRFSELPLLHLLRYNRRVPKIARPPENACDVPEFANQWGHSSGSRDTAFFDDPHRPLVVDLGCGRGMWLLQLFCKGGAAYSAGWNGLGVDTSPRLLAYPDGVVARERLKGRLRFALGHAEEVAHRLLSYPGHVIFIGLHFPTPFALHQDASKRNSQLPSHQDFMVSPLLMNTLKRLPGSTLFFQSDTEDVALRMRDQVEMTGTFEIPIHLDPFGCIEKPLVGTNHTDVDMATAYPTLRQERAFSSLPDFARRAVGSGWLERSPFPPTETEVRCMADSKKVYRFAAVVP